ncbi:hypothetical protein [Variovorax sp. ZT5P30]|uniref:hypothetical protein n=1 Tax=Variovorax sp. ZT5P30 TaxID=3443735 RepID=UPI003F4697F6
MRKRTRRKPVIGLDPFQKAEIRRAWRADSVKAGIHALIGEDAQELVQQAGGILYGVISACDETGIEGDDADVSIVHTAARALLQQASKDTIDETLRASIVDGLAACERLQPRLDPASIQRAASEVMKAGQGR